MDGKANEAFGEDKARGAPAGAAFYRGLLESLCPRVLVLDHAGTILYAGPGAAGMLGRVPGELSGRYLAEFVHPEDRLLVEGSFWERKEARERLEGEGVRWRGGDGTWRTLALRVQDLLEAPEARGVAVRLLEEPERAGEKDGLDLVADAVDLLLKQSLFGVLVLVGDRVRFVNRAAAGILGYGVEEILGWAPGEYRRVLLVDSPRPGFELGVITPEAASRGEKSFRCPVMRPDGESRWVRVYTAVLDPGPRDVRVMVMADVTGQVSLEDMLRESEQRYRLLFEYSPAGIVMYDRGLVVVNCNRRMAEIVGSDRDTIIGLCLRGIRDRRVLPALEAVLKGKRGTYRGPYRATTSEAKIYISLETTPVFDPEGRVTGGIGIVQDVTEQHEIMERLERINRLFLTLGADIMDNMDKIIFAARDILGGEAAFYGRREKGKLVFLTTLPGEAGLILSEGKAEAGGGDLPFGGGEPLAVKDLRAWEGREWFPWALQRGWRRLLGFPVLYEGRVLGCLGVFFAGGEVFPRSETETLGMLARALEREEERLAREEKLKDFIDIASHELRHPVTLMKGYALTLRDYAERLDADQRKNFLEIISEGADRLDLLIKELLDISRIERGRFSLQKKDVELGVLVRRAVEEMREKTPGRRFRVDVPPDMGARRVDPEKFVRLLVILLDNAVRYSPPDTPVDITAERRGGETVVSVLDRGVGIPEEERELIFERFYQVGDTLHHTTSGMGLGLFIAREIAEAHGGRIWCEPRPGGGSAFRVTLPA